MFKEFYEAGPKIQIGEKDNLTVAHEGRLSAIKALKAGVQNESLPVGVRLVRANALVTLLKEEVALSKNSVESKIDLAEAESYRDQLLVDSSNESTIKKPREVA